jgi:predicted ferric reductase
MKNFLKVLLVVFIILQFFRIDKTNPPVDKNMDFLPSKKHQKIYLKLLKALATIVIQTKQYILGMLTYNHLDGF